ncbi:DUF1365 domain-containing protein [Pseudomonas sp. 7P_10.2_Bac1]|uniref:DUF1365 domain-containing protein n=1 Tax=Pseudomonas sp. 7P_10.2_Bac1 TaxID=2971614 RepID=UPI0021CA4FC9|nr:DUF1365 domain-containing protein [Pseudomonas sp. 7P_10.2_Bac1]MCU1726225.1 DUF1365 domain-containing protein [Pseudomonas sp. 7P_10.2_Bac1]
MNSALYSGWVSHRRLLPRVHGFRYRMGMLYLDLAEQAQVLGLSWLAGRSRWGAFTFRETDYLPHATRQGVMLSDAVRQLVEQALGHAPQGRICLLTQPRTWGLSFNPISLFYCYETDGRLAAILCEVTNTPWRERYHYVLPTHASGESRHRVAKSFHVSPFLPRDLEYRMRFSAPGQTLNVTMQDWQGEQKIFEAGMGLKRTELTRQSLHRHLLAFPWITGKTVLAIYWQALRLLIKRIPLFSHQAAHGEHRTATLESRHDQP